MLNNNQNTPTGRQHMAASKFWGMSVASLVFAEVVALGANNDFLAVLSSVLEVSLALVVLVFFASNAFLRSVWPAMVLGLALIFCAIVPYLPMLTRGQIDVQPGAFVAPDLALPGMVRLSCALAFLLAAGSIGYRRGQARVVLDSLIVLGLIQIIIGLTLRQIDPEHIWGSERPMNALRFSGTMTNSNANSCVAAAIVVMAIARLRTLSAVRLGRLPTNGDWALRGACFLAAVGGLGVCTISGSRVPLVLGIGGGVCALFLGASPMKTLRRSPAAIAFISVVILAGLALGGRTLERFSTLSADGVSRLVLWRHYAALINHLPAFGYGLRTFSALNVRTLDDPSAAVSLWFVNSAHDTAIEILLEGGWVFAAIALLLLVCIAVSLIKSSKSMINDPTSITLSMGIFVIIACSMVDIALDVPSIVSLALLLLGVLWGHSVRSRLEASLPFGRAVESDLRAASAR